MKRTIGMSIQLHNEAKALAEKEKRISDIAALCDAARRGGIAIDRALSEIIETAGGDAAVDGSAGGHPDGGLLVGAGERRALEHGRADRIAGAPDLGDGALEHPEGLQEPPRPRAPVLEQFDEAAGCGAAPRQRLVAVPVEPVDHRVAGSCVGGV